MSRKINNQKAGQRQFGGKLTGFVDRKEANFEKKHLKAYLKGWDYFTYGRNKNNEPVWHKTKEIWNE